MSNLYPINGNSTPNQIKESLRELQENIDIILEMQEMTAKILRRKFVALVKEGFTEEQALELCE